MSEFVMPGIGGNKITLERASKRAKYRLSESSRAKRRAQEKRRRARKREAKRLAKAARIKHDSELLLAAAADARSRGVDRDAVEAVVTMIWWDELSNQCSGFVHPDIKALIYKPGPPSIFKEDFELALLTMFGWDKERVGKRLRYSEKYLLPGRGRSDIFISVGGTLEQNGEKDEVGKEIGSASQESACDSAGSAVGQGPDGDCAAQS